MVSLFYGFKEAWTSVIFLTPIMFMVVKLVMLNVTGMDVLPEFHLFWGIFLGLSLKDGIHIKLPIE